MKMSPSHLLLTHAHSHSLTHTHSLTLKESDSHTRRVFDTGRKTERANNWDELWATTDHTNVTMMQVSLHYFVDNVSQ
jgi:hypothetical protein